MSKQLTLYKKFEPCLDQLKRLDSLNQVDPKVFDQTLTFIQNKKVLELTNKPVSIAIENSQTHMQNVCKEINLENIGNEIHVWAHLILLFLKAL